MFSEDLARDVQGAELMITQHSELKAEIDTKEEKYESLFGGQGKLGCFFCVFVFPDFKSL